MRAIGRVVVAIVAAALLAVPVAAAGPEARLVRDIDASRGSDPQYLTRAAGAAFFAADDAIHGRELWVTDGTEAGTRMVRDIRPGSAGSAPADLTRVGVRLFFLANDGIHGRELWVSYGTSAGTKLVKDVAKGPKGSFISAIADGGSTAYFARAHRDLWRTDGTAKGTALLREFMGVAIEGANAMGSTLYFPADDALWKTNGTTASTKRLSPSYWGLDGVTKFRGRIYYRAHPSSEIGFGGLPELWWTDGTKAGTRRMGTMLNPTDMTVMADSLYFNAHQSGTKGARLYRGDGTPAGTGPVSPRTRPLWGMVKEAGRLWTNGMLRDAGFEPEELWVSDGTAAGTALVYGGTGDWFNTGWDDLDRVGLDGRLWFAAGPGGPVSEDQWTLFDHEPWSSDGTAEGTVEAVDINPDGSSFPREFMKLGTTILFSADDGEHGRELWSLTLP